MKASNRKTRSDKFPLTFHPTGQYCKKKRPEEKYITSALTGNRHFKRFPEQAILSFTIPEVIHTCRQS
jgi:hypothetical protein